MFSQIFSLSAMNIADLESGFDTGEELIKKRKRYVLQN